MRPAVFGPLGQVAAQVEGASGAGGAGVQIRRSGTAARPPGGARPRRRRVRAVADRAVVAAAVGIGLRARPPQVMPALQAGPHSSSTHGARAAAAGPAGAAQAHARRGAGGLRLRRRSTEAQGRTRPAPAAREQARVVRPALARRRWRRPGWPRSGRCRRAAAHADVGHVVAHAPAGAARRSRQARPAGLSQLSSTWPSQSLSLPSQISCWAGGDRARR